MNFLIVVVLLLCTGLISKNSAVYTNGPLQDNPELGTCEQITSELGDYKDTFTTWGQTVEGDPQFNSQSRSADGEPFSIGTTIYKSKSSFKKSLKNIHALELSSSTPLLDDKGRQVGERVVRELKLNGKLTNVFIWRITDRMIKGISGSSLELALKVEKANFFCREELERRQKNQEMRP